MSRKYTKPPAAEFRGFIQYELSLDERQLVKAWLFPEDVAFEQILRLAEEGYKISLSWDHYNQCHQCLLNCANPQHENAGWILSGRGSSPHKALKQALYKHLRIFDGIWSAENNRPNGDIDD